MREDGLITNLPTGTVTFLFTDIEDSTRLWQEQPGVMSPAHARHNEILREAIESNHGFIFQIVGDSFSAAFHNAVDAIRATLSAQRGMQQNSENSEALIRIRMGLHTGTAELTTDGNKKIYDGYVTVATAQRVMSVAYGQQVLLSQTTRDLLQDDLPENISMRDMGEHRLKGLREPLRLYQLVTPDLQQEFPPLKSLDARANNLPTQLTSFIGRERERADVHEKLASARLLTLIGPGGTGKTRLSLQIAEEQLPNFKDGVWLVELAPIADSAFIVSAIASVFELREVQNIPLISILLDYLRSRHLLLILDNCEHMVEASAQIANQILQACPNLKIIASSREALGMEGETVYRVPSLMDDEATRLFIERATKADSRFKLTQHNAASIAQICSRLDGIPLAIELAAARVKLFTPEQIAERLGDRFKLLTGGSRTALPRQQTLRALIDWSYQTLNETEQRALRQLAVFSGGWSFDGAEAVIGENEALEGLLGLVNKSLINVEEQGGESRYRFLETIRQYAMEKLLESGEAIEARNHHLDYVLQIAEQSGQRMFGAESQAWLNQMEIEHDNLRAALEWSTAHHLEKAMRLAMAIGGFWTSRDHNSEARNWCRTILERSEALPNVDSERAKVYALWGWTSITTGNHKEGRAAGEAGLVLARRVDDKQAIVRLLIIIGLASLFLGDFSTALQAPEEAIGLAQKLGYKGELAMGLTTYAQANFFTKRDLELSKKYLEEAVRLGTEAGFQWATSMSAYGAGRLAGYIGDIETARARLTESAEISKRFGNRRIVYSSRSELAHILREHGELDEALSIYREVIPGWKELGHRAAVAHELECIAYILAKREEFERAATLHGAAEALREVIDTDMTKIERDEYEREVNDLRANMDSNEFASNWAQGRSITMEQAIALALEDSNG